MNSADKKVLAALSVVAVLALAFWYGGSAPGLRGWEAAPLPAPSATALAPSASQTARLETVTPTLVETAAPLETPPSAPTPGRGETPRPSPEDNAEAQVMPPDARTGKGESLTDPVPEGKPLPVEPKDAVISDTAYTCTLSVRCDTILEHPDWPDSGKAELVPGDGVIFPAAQVTFYGGESVLDVLLREMKRKNIHMEYVNTPLYQSAYIEGINNLYEFDFGERSGWMYRVNGWFPSYGCSRYSLQDGDTVEWVYTCDLGADVGGPADTDGLQETKEGTQP